MIFTKIRTLTAGSLLALAVLFIAVIALSNNLISGVRIDLTENSQYTLSEGTKNILANIDEPINLYFYYSDHLTKDFPSVRAFATRVRELLEEYADLAGGKLILQVIDPFAFSEEEDQAAQYGLQGVPLPNGDSLYFGLAGTNALDGGAAIPFFQREKESFLEYDLTKLIHSLINPTKPLVGIMTGLELTGGFNMQTRQPSEPWVISGQIEQLFTVRAIPPTNTSIDEDIDVLFLVHPKGLTDETLYAIDQFVLRGGNLVVFVDPHAEADRSADDPNNPTAGLFAPRNSEFGKLFDAWGVKFDSNQVLADAQYALQISARGSGRPVRHLGILSLTAQAMNQDEVISADLESINVSTAGTISLKEGSDLVMVPLLKSSNKADLMPVDKFRFLPDPTSLARDFHPSDEEFWIAVRLQGKVKSAFPEGLEGMTGGLTESAENINVVVVADTDVLTDRLWVRVQKFFGQNIVSAWANNGDFVFNTLDTMTGSDDLISIRGRASAVRPFTRVDELRLAADEEFRATELQLKDKLKEVQKKLSELQSNKSNDSILVLNAEQSQALASFQEKKLTIRKDLRQVRRKLDQEIEGLGSRLKFINIALVPILLTLFALYMGMRRTRRK